MITLRTPEEIEFLRQSGRIVGQLLEKLRSVAVEGVSTKELDEFAEDFITSRGAQPAFKGYHGYPCTLCTSLNDEVVHGIPSGRILKRGDVLSIDAGAVLNGYYGDAAVTFSIGRVDPEVEKLIKVTEESLYKGIEQAKEGMHLSDISYAIQKHVEIHGFSVVRDFVGHGIGTRLHEDPQVPNFGPQGQGPFLKAGMVLAIEPMVNQGTWRVSILEDKWTAVTQDGRLSAHFEHTLAIGKDGPEVLTDSKK